MAANSSSEQVLQDLMKDTEQAISTLESRGLAAADLEMEFADISQKFEAAAQIKQEKERNLRLEVLTKDLIGLRKDVEREERDLAQAVFGLNAMLESMGEEYGKLQKLDDSEQLLINTAEQALARAQVNRQRAAKRWFFRQSFIESADQQLQQAEQRREEARAEAKRRARHRLLNANMESSLQTFMLRVEQTIQIMERRMVEINKQLQAVAGRKQKAFQVKEEAARILEKLDQDLNAREDELRREEEQLESLAHGSQEYAAQERKISDLRTDVERIRGNRNTAFVLHQSKDKFAVELEIHEKTQIKLRDNQRMWITSLRSDTEERVVTFRSRLEAMKAAADQDIAKTLDDMGSEADQRNAEYMAKIGAATDRLRMDKIEKHPKRVAEMAKAAAAQAEAVQEIRVREQAAIEDFKRKYGVDPTLSSFFHYQSDDSGSDGGDTGIF